MPKHITSIDLTVRESFPCLSPYLHLCLQQLPFYLEDKLWPTFFELVCTSKQFKSLNLGNIRWARFEEFLKLINLHQVPVRSLAIVRNFSDPMPCKTKELEQLFAENVYLTKCSGCNLEFVKEYMRRNKFFKNQKRFKTIKVAPHTADPEIVGKKRKHLEFDPLDTEDYGENERKQHKAAHDML